MFTLPMFKGGTYVYTSPALAVAIHRASSPLDVDMLIAEVTPCLVGSSEETKTIIRDVETKAEADRTL